MGSEVRQTWVWIHLLSDFGQISSAVCASPFIYKIGSQMYLYRRMVVRMNWNNSHIAQILAF